MPLLDDHVIHGFQSLDVHVTGSLRFHKCICRTGFFAVDFLLRCLAVFMRDLHSKWTFGERPMSHKEVLQ